MELEKANEILSDPVKVSEATPFEQALLALIQDLQNRVSGAVESKHDEEPPHEPVEKETRKRRW